MNFSINHNVQLSISLALSPMAATASYSVCARTLRAHFIISVLCLQLRISLDLDFEFLSFCAVLRALSPLEREKYIKMIFSEFPPLLLSATFFSPHTTHASPLSCSLVNIALDFCD
jgi:hypothetical protein